MERNVGKSSLGSSPARDFLPLLEAKLRKLLEQRERISQEIEETSKMMDELKVKLAGGELPLPTGEAPEAEFPDKIQKNRSSSE